MKKQVLAAMIGTVTAISTLTAHASEVGISSYGYQMPQAPMTCTLVQLAQPGVEPIVKTTAPSSLYKNGVSEATFKMNDSQIVAVGHLEGTNEGNFLQMDILGSPSPVTPIKNEQTVSFLEPVQKLNRMDCTQNYSLAERNNAFQSVWRSNAQGGYNNGGSLGGTQWTIGQTNFKYALVTEAKYEVQSGANWSSQRDIHFRMDGYTIVGYQVNSGFGPSSKTNGMWSQPAGGVGQNNVHISFVNQSLRNMKYGVSIFYVQNPQ